MANLIITIISIALVAVAALMGAYYGGTAFLQGQAKARATTMLNNYRQMEAALRLWALNSNNGQLPNPMNNNPVVPANSSHLYRRSEVGAFMGTTYIDINSIPFVSYYHSTWNNPILITDNSPENAAEGGMQTTLTADVCRQLEGLRSGTVPANNRNYTAAATTNAVYCGFIGCFYDDSPGGTAFYGDYIAYYRLNGKPLSASADCT